MEIQDQRTIRAKAFSAKAIMKSPKLMALINDACNAPIGSTKRKEAKAVLRSMEQIHRNYSSSVDGQGGYYINPFAAAKDGQGGAATSTWPSMSGKNWTGGNVDVNLNPGAINTSAPTKTTGPNVYREGAEMGQVTLPRQRVFVKTVDDIMPTKNKTGRINPTTGQFEADIPGVPFEETTPKHTTGAEGPGEITTPTTTWTPSSDLTNLSVGAATGKITSQGQLNIPTTPTGTGAMSDNPTAEEILNLYETQGQGAVTQWYNSLDSSQKELYKDLYDLFMSGAGANTAARSLITNFDFLSKALNLPKEVLDMLPQNGLVSTQLKKLATDLKKDFDIDYWTNKMNSMINTDYMAEDIFTDYIRGKDQYLGSLDKLYDEAQTKFAYMDTSNPYVKQRTDNYLTYLTILKGRQNQRYANFLDTAVNMYKAQLSATEQHYQTSVNAYNEQYKYKAAETAEIYTTVKEMLVDMYQSLEKQEELYTKKQELELDQTKAANQLMIDLMKMEGEYGTTPTYDKSGNIIGWETTGTGKKNKPDYSVIANAMGINEGTKDGKPVFTMSNYNLNDALMSAANSGEDETVAYNYFTNAVKSVAETETSGGNIDWVQNLTANFATLQEAKEKAKDETLSAEERQQYQDQVDTMTDFSDRVSQGLYNGIKTYLTGLDTEIEKVRDAINDIVKNRSKQEVVNNFRDTINPSILSLLYDYAHASEQYGITTDDGQTYTPDKIFEGVKDESDTELIDYLANELASTSLLNIGAY